MKKQVIIDYRTDITSINELLKLGYEPIFTLPVDTLYKEVKGHADMQIHIVNGKGICAPEVYQYYKETNLNIELICGSVKIGSKYPYDIAYNACGIGNYAVCKISNTAPEILSEYHSLKREILNTKQGYTKCSICIVNEESLITADEGIYQLTKNHGLNVLKISPCDIELYSMNGFIGGASGLLEENLLAFNGDIKTHHDGEIIIDFCKNVHVDTICLNSGKLKDIGSILRI